MQLDLFALLQIPEEYTVMLQRYAAAMILLAILIMITRWQGIGIGSKLIVGTIRGTIQIVLMALILVYIFAISDLIVIFGVLSFMSFFAAYTARSNLERVPGVMRATLPAIFIGSLSVMAVTIALEIIDWRSGPGEFIIPMGGMVIGNCMVLTSLVIDRMWSNAQKQRPLLETALALGATPMQATELTIRESIRSGLLPNLNRYASLGIVSIPGLMSGMIIGGVNPLEAALYQIIIFIMIFLAGIISALITSRLFLREMFNERAQLTVPPPEL